MSLLRALGAPASACLCLSVAAHAETLPGYAGQVNSRGNAPPTEYAEAVPHGNGAFTSYGTVVAGVPQAIGVRFPASTLTGRPAEPSDGKWDVVDDEGNVVWHCCGHERVLEVTDNLADGTLFQHTVVNWNPHGHIPPGVFDTPHYDFHFYIIDEAIRATIEAPEASDMCELGDGSLAPVDCETFAVLTAPLPADQFPPDYIRPGAVEPGMGDHPSEYCIKYHPAGRDVYTVSLERFVYLPASVE